MKREEGRPDTRELERDFADLEDLPNPFRRLRADALRARRDAFRVSAKSVAALKPRPPEDASGKLRQLREEMKTERS